MADAVRLASVEQVPECGGEECGDVSALPCAVKSWHALLERSPELTRLEINLAILHEDTFGVVFENAQVVPPRAGTVTLRSTSPLPVSAASPASSASGSNLNTPTYGYLRLPAHPPVHTPTSRERCPPLPARATQVPAPQVTHRVRAAVHCRELARAAREPRS